MTGGGDKFTVLGAGGFVGSHLVRHLKDRGIDCDAPARDDASIFDRPLGNVIYCIGLTADYLARPFDTVEAHVSLFSRLLRDADFDRLVYLSSTRLYDSGGAEGHAENDLILNPGNSRHLYDFSKGLGETLCKVCGDGKTAVARLSCVYADDLAADNFLHGLISQALSADAIALETHAGLARDYVHVDDVCEALVAIARRGTRHIYNVASGVNIANGTLFDIVSRCTGCRIDVRPPAGGHVPVAPLIDIGALREDFALTPRSVAGYLPTLIARHREAHGLRRAV